MSLQPSQPAPQARGTAASTARNGTTTKTTSSTCSSMLLGSGSSSGRAVVWEAVGAAVIGFLWAVGMERTGSAGGRTNVPPREFPAGDPAENLGQLRAT